MASLKTRDHTTEDQERILQETNVLQNKKNQTNVLNNYDTAFQCHLNDISRKTVAQEKDHSITPAPNESNEHHDHKHKYL